MAKTAGSTLEYSSQRSHALMREYDRYIEESPYIRTADLFEHIVRQPCRRFWVSETRATVVVAAMLRGDRLERMRPTKREMFNEIYSRTVAMMAERPGTSLFRIVSDVVRQPAPRFYLTASSAKVMVYKLKKEWYERKRRRLRR